MRPICALTSARLSYWMSASVTAFYLLMLTAPSGFSWGASMLLLGSIGIFLARNTCTQDFSHAAPWSSEDRSLCWLLLAFFLITALTVLWHGNPGKYLDQGVRYLLVIPIVFGLRHVRLRLDWLWAGLSLGLIAVVPIAWWQVRHLSPPRASGFLTSAIPFGDIALSMAFWCLMGACLAVSRRRSGWAMLLAVGTMAGIYAFIASATRGGLVAIPVFAVLAAIALLRREHLRRLCIGGAIVITCMYIVLATTPVGEVATNRYAGAIAEWNSYTQENNAHNDVGLRLEAWKAALISIPQRPILGWSYADYEQQIQHLAATGQMDPYAVKLANTHNNFIEVWLHQGILGLISFLALIIASFWFFCRRLRAPNLTVRILACCGASLPSAFTMYGLTQVILGRNNGVMFFLVSLAVLWAAMRQAEAEATTSQHSSHD